VHDAVVSLHEEDEVATVGPWNEMVEVGVLQLTGRTGHLRARIDEVLQHPGMLPGAHDRDRGVWCLATAMHEGPRHVGGIGMETSPGVLAGMKQRREDA